MRCIHIITFSLFLIGFEAGPAGVRNVTTCSLKHSGSYEISNANADDVGGQAELKSQKLDTMSASFVGERGRIAAIAREIISQ